MKGVVFVELLAMADSVVGEEAVDKVVARCPLSTKGAYTAVGTYPAEELTHLVGGFSEASGASIDVLQKRFGHWMLAHFVETSPELFKARADVFSMLEAIDGEVHAEVRKLYPDAELPHFETERVGDDTLRMIYSSPRRLMAFCHGLIEACVEYYGEPASVTFVDRSTPSLGIADFTIRQMPRQAG